MPPVAAQRCCRVETIGGLTGLLHRTLKKNNNKITMVRIALVTIAIMVIVIQRCCAYQIIAENK